jgi:hypothetical protein
MDKGEKRKIYQVRCIDGLGVAGNGRGGDPLSPGWWGRAEVLSDFSFPWTEAEAPQTLFRALWDEVFFYFRYEVVDLDLVLGGGGSAMDKVIGSDRVEIFFSTGLELDPYYGLEIDPRGEVLAYKGKYHRIMDWDWECPGLQVWPEETGSGYHVEGVIPMETFRSLGCLHSGLAGDFLLAGLFRAEFSHGADGKAVDEDWISWIDPGGETPDFHVPSAFGVLNFER